MDWSAAIREFFIWFPAPLLSFLGGAFGAVVGYWFAKERFRFETIHLERLGVMKELYLAVVDMRQKTEAYFHRRDADSLREFREASLTMQHLQARNKIFLRVSEFEKIQSFTNTAFIVIEKARIFEEYPEMLHAGEGVISATEQLWNALKPDGVVSLLQNGIENDFRRTLWIDEISRVALFFSFLSPNQWSVLRIFMGLAAFALLFARVPSWFIAGWLVFAMATDYIDGAVARARGLVSETGKWLDPLADKIVYLPLFAYFTWVGRTDVWWIAVFMLADVAGTVFRPWLTAAATMWGKTKLCLAFALALWFVVLPDASALADTVVRGEYFSGWLLAALAVASVISKIPALRR